MNSETGTEKKVILIVDDTPDNLRLLTGVLKNRGKYKLKAATSGQKALTIAQKSPAPDVVLLDIMMPEMDGYEVFNHLKNNQDTANIPVIFISANKSDIDRKKGLELGALAYLTKPVDNNQLFKILDQLFEAEVCGGDSTNKN